MRCIVPLAGPDFERFDGTTRAEQLVEGQPLLRRAIESRSWWRSGLLKSDDLIFVLRDTPRSMDFAQNVLQSWYPESHNVFLGDYTEGAALTALGGVALSVGTSPICIDLADILFDDDLAVEEAFQNNDVGGLLMTFTADHPAYSYAELDQAGNVARTAEKRVISDIASAGVYFFRDAPTLLRAIGHSIEHRETLAYNGLLFVCPLFNGVIADGGIVQTYPVQNVRDIKVMGLP